MGAWIRPDAPMNCDMLCLNITILLCSRFISGVSSAAGNRRKKQLHRENSTPTYISFDHEDTDYTNMMADLPELDGAEITRQSTKASSSKASLLSTLSHHTQLNVLAEDVGTFALRLGDRISFLFKKR